MFYSNISLINCVAFNNAERVTILLAIPFNTGKSWIAPRYRIANTSTPKRHYS